MNERHGLLLLDGELVPGTVRYEGERIVEVVRKEDSPGRPEGDAPPSSVPLSVIAPGFIDLHVHGFGGHDPTEDLTGMTLALAGVGTTAFLPTLFPDEPGALGACAERMARAAASDERTRTAVLGAHLEGPFVNPNQAGALPKDRLAEPSLAALRALLGSSTGDGRGIRAVTLAPELPGSKDLVEELRRAGVRVSLGHSLATAAEARAAATAGAAGATHLYNAMRPLHHREAGLLGYALASDALVCELIGDLVHVGPDAVELALRARGPEGLALVSDALRGAGSGCDVFHSHGHECRVTGGAIWIDDADAPEGRRLTGAAAPQLDAIRRLTRAGVVSLAEALVMASETPARALGLEDERGRLVPGARADLVTLAGEDLELSEVLVGGHHVRHAPPA